MDHCLETINSYVVSVRSLYHVTLMFGIVVIDAMRVKIAETGQYKYKLWTWTGSWDLKAGNRLPVVSLFHTCYICDCFHKSMIVIVSISVYRVL